MNTKLPSLTNLQICHFSILLATNKQPAIIASFLPRWYFSPLGLFLLGCAWEKQQQSLKAPGQQTAATLRQELREERAPTPLNASPPSPRSHQPGLVTHGLACVRTLPVSLPSPAIRRTVRAGKILVLNANGNILMALNEDCLWQKPIHSLFYKLPSRGTQGSRASFQGA